MCVQMFFVSMLLLLMYIFVQMYRYRLKHYPSISMTKDVKTPETTLGNEITNGESDKEI